MWLHGLPLHTSYANVYGEVLSLETSCISGPLNERNSVTLRVSDPFRARMEDERMIPSWSREVRDGALLRVNGRASF